MGRYYEGDIDGKFWFAVQSSDDGEFFGAEEQESNWIDYYVDKEIFKEINGIKKCKKQLTFKHNGKTKRWWVLHDNWQKVVDEHYKANTNDPDKKHKYIGFAEWLKKEHDIGTGERSFTDAIDSEFNTIYVWLARLDMGRKMQKFFKDNPKEDYLSFQAEC
tara:strand:+ start:194 stop:676 length:483 start_codon:yes stop_codon:yes gene_type:complete